MSSPFSEAQINSALKALESVGVETGKLRAHLSSNPKDGELLIYAKDDPVVHILLDLGRPDWEKHLSNPDFAQPVVRLLNQLLIQQEYYRFEVNPDKMREILSRVSRRTVLLGSRDVKFFLAEHRRVLLKSDQLPPTSLTRLDFHLDPATSRQIQNYILWSNRIDSGELGTAHRFRGDYDLGGTDYHPGEQYFEGDEIRIRKPKDKIKISHPVDGRKAYRFRGAASLSIQTSSAFTAMVSGESIIKPAGYELLRYVQTHRNKGSLSTLSSEETRFLAMATLEILHGFPALDSTHVGLNDHSGLLGYVSGSQIVIRLANGFYHEAAVAWMPKLLPLPLANECEELIRLLSAEFPAAQVLGECRLPKENFTDCYRRQFNRFMKKVLPGYRGTATNVGRIWVQTGLDQGITSPILGILRGNPLPGARGEAAYVTVTYKELCVSLRAIQSKIRMKAGTVTYDAN